ncbi:MAG: Ig-like domain-containing protein, partial [Cryomorphaceae bacterium]|nr:Ig-like domain-containing protein [Cryomorphaceae bacterium]
MDFRLFIIFVVLLSSCAQVGTITGGEKDTVAPNPTQTIPENGSVEFNQKSFTMDFDEFIQLNSPLQTMSIVPGGIKLDAQLNKKLVTVTLEGDFKPNTTYVISFNGTIKDVTEGNDSLLQYVFSTGTSIDSAEFCVNVTDAWTLAPLDKIVVGLFTDTNEVSPYYFAKTGKDGMARFRYLRNGKYVVRAFEDMNGDLSIQPQERCGFSSDTANIQAGDIDTAAVRVFNPISKRKVNT